MSKAQDCQNKNLCSYRCGGVRVLCAICASACMCTSPPPFLLLPFLLSGSFSSFFSTAIFLLLLYFSPKLFPWKWHPSLSAIQSQPLHLEHYQKLPPNLTHHKELHRKKLSAVDTNGNPPKSQPSEGTTQKLLIHCLHYKRPPTPNTSLGATQRQPLHCQHKQRTAPHTPHKSYSETTSPLPTPPKFPPHTSQKATHIWPLPAKTIRDIPTPNTSHVIPHTSHSVEQKWPFTANKTKHSPLHLTPHKMLHQDSQSTADNTREPPLSHRHTDIMTMWGW